MESQRFTHREYSTYCSRVSLTARRVPVVWVQVRRRRAVLCGRVVGLGEFAERGEWFKVETDIGQFWAESRHVRLCSGDGRCACEVSA